jgi:hypothetical protein
MSNEEDTHDKLINACLEYIKSHERFEHKFSSEAGIKARYWLSEIRTLASERRVEIQEARKQRKIARKGKAGRPRKLHTG